MSEWITVLVLDTGYGTSVWACRNDEIAYAELDKFVVEYWRNGVGDELMPDDRDARRERYFEVAGSDWYDIETVKIVEPDDE